MVIERAPLEDELGDVLDKAIRHAGLTELEVAQQCGIRLERLLGSIDYTERLTVEELAKVSSLLQLNPAGLQAVASEAYPLPEIRGLPFCLYPLRMPHGIGVANAYLVAECSAEWGILFDTGTGPEGLWRSWPTKLKRVAAVFLTHYETEHCGGLQAVRARFPEAAVFGPAAATRPQGVIALVDGAQVQEAGFRITVRSTPGHAEGHHCYEIEALHAPQGARLLISGDLLFAGSIGGAYFCEQRLRTSLATVFAKAEDEWVVAPGHGPLTTIGNERRFNPFAPQEEC